MALPLLVIKKIASNSNKAHHPNLSIFILNIHTPMQVLICKQKVSLDYTYMPSSEEQIKNRDEQHKLPVTVDGSYDSLKQELK